MHRRGGEPEVEVISFNDPAYQTVFSDTSNYEPPGRRDDFTFGEYVARSLTDPPSLAVEQQPTATGRSGPGSGLGSDSN